jgi:hypothetical protein
LNYDIENYQAVKRHLLSFGRERLEQSGKPFARKKTGNQWFETQDSISYWDDFNNQVIAWQRITQKNTFCITEPGIVVLDSMAFISRLGDYAFYLLAILNSPLIYLWIKTNVPEYGDTGFRLSNQFVTQMEIPIPSQLQLNNLNEATKKIVLSKKPHKDDIQILNQLIFELYKLDHQEGDFILSRTKY